MLEDGKFSLFIHPEAQSEIKEHYWYYEAKSSQLGEKFLAEIEISFSLLSEAPSIWPKVGYFHKYTLQKFPFLIFYTFRAGEIAVYTVAHSSRRPFYWLPR